MLAKGKHHPHSTSPLVPLSRLHSFIKARSACRGFSNVFDKACLALGLSVDILGPCVVVQYSQSSQTPPFA